MKQFLRHLSSLKPTTVTIGIAPSPRLSITELVGKKPGVTLLRMKDHLPSSYDILKMTPYEITSHIGEIIKSCDAVVMPGSRWPIHGLFTGLCMKPYDEDPIQHAFLYYSFLRMAATYHTVKSGKPLLASCDGVNFPTILLGGTCAWVDRKKGEIFHNEDIDHPLIIPKNSWLYQHACTYPSSEYNLLKDIVIPRVCSTHPLYQKTLPPGATALAYSTDMLPAVIAYNAYTLGMQDHLEYRKSKDVSPILLAEYGTSEPIDFQKATEISAANHLFDGMVDRFIQLASAKKAFFCDVPKPQINEKTEETITSKEPQRMLLDQYHARLNAQTNTHGR